MNDSRENEKRQDAANAVLWFVLIITLLAMTVMGAKCYLSAVNGKKQDDHIRETLAYLQSRGDGSGKVTIKKSDDGDMLCFSEEDSALETRIYVYEGMLTEELTKTDAPSVPEKGQAICAVQSFEAELFDSGIVMITVDGNCGYIGKGEMVSEQ